MVEMGVWREVEEGFFFGESKSEMMEECWECEEPCRNQSYRQRKEIISAFFCMPNTWKSDRLNFQFLGTNRYRYNLYRFRYDQTDFGSLYTDFGTFSGNFDFSRKNVIK